MSDILIRLRSLFRRKSIEAELDHELKFHFERQVEKYVQSGMPREEAKRRARLDFGGLDQVKEECRDARGVSFIETTIQDIRFAIRLLRKTPAVSAVALLSLALGIGANTAIFSLMDAVMLRALPVQKPEELVQIRFHAPGASDTFVNGVRVEDTRRTYTNPMWEQVRDHQDVFAGVFAWSPTGFNLANGGESQYVNGLYASGDYFTTLGVKAAIGRLLTTADDRRGCSGAAVLGYGFWQQHYAGAESAVGSLIRLDGHLFPVIGVTQPEFFGTDLGDRFDVAIPICAEAILQGKNSMLDNRSGWWLLMMGRLKPGINNVQAMARLNVLAPEIFGAAVPLNWPLGGQAKFRKYTFVTLPAATGVEGFSSFRDQYTRPLEILMVVVGLVLLIACANIASLTLARSTARQREIAVRLSLGAPRRRLIRQMLTESVVLSAGGALAGFFFARWGAGLLVGYLAAAGKVTFLDLSPDGRVFAFTAAVAVLTGILFGVWPALRATRVTLLAAMKGGDPARRDGERSRFYSARWIVAAQVAFSLVLLVGTGLFVRSFTNLLTLDPGFDRRNVLLVSMNIHNAGVPTDARLTLYSQILDRVKSIPGVISASQMWFTPFSGAEWNQWIKVNGYQPPPGEEPLVWFNWVTPEYFATLRTPLVAGRTFDSRDTPTSTPVAIVNETMARRFFPKTDPIGKFFRFADAPASTPSFQIIGLAKDSKYESLRESNYPFAYFPLAQISSLPESSSFEIRTGVNPAALISEVKDAIGGVNKTASLEFTTLAQQVDDSLTQERLLALLSAFFGGLALLLTAIGLYGVMAYVVTQRTHEIGIRMALGARRGSILRLVMRDIAVLLAAGVAGGILGAFWITRFVQHLLFGLTATDTATMLLAAAALVIVAVVASYLPARRAMRVDPMVALRYE